MLIGYARVSSEDQNLDLQFDALKKAGCSRMFSDKLSGIHKMRPGLDDALSHLRSSDTFVIWKLDRLGRNLKGLIVGCPKTQFCGYFFCSTFGPIMSAINILAHCWGHEMQH
ncbi:hypothetical protein BuS5_00847 [Desulfosarcina sp. BuS5]|uniref:recombinase family protein n=1 Tax=Desulfosarcina sp. BuS5 TaxID=933262 RepID=UPI00279D07FC|nr:hypothetical protein BuS5_00847 [Desulfosarcina sp. BuS5]